LSHLIEAKQDARMCDLDIILVLPLALAQAGEPVIEVTQCRREYVCVCYDFAHVRRGDCDGRKRLIKMRESQMVPYIGHNTPSEASKSAEAVLTCGLRFALETDECLRVPSYFIWQKLQCDKTSVFRKGTRAEHTPTELAEYEKTHERIRGLFAELSELRKAA
jgi:hypothetical protein